MAFRNVAPPAVIPGWPLSAGAQESSPIIHQPQTYVIPERSDGIQPFRE